MLKPDDDIVMNMPGWWSV